MIYTKAKKPHWANENDKIYLTRKDRYHESASTSDHYIHWSYYRKKPWRKIANRLIRRNKIKLSDGGNYKKAFDITWSIW